MLGIAEAGSEGSRRLTLQCQTIPNIIIVAKTTRNTSAIMYPTRVAGSSASYRPMPMLLAAGVVRQPISDRPSRGRAQPAQDWNGTGSGLPAKAYQRLALAICASIGRSCGIEGGRPESGGYEALMRAAPDRPSPRVPQVRRVWALRRDRSDLIGKPTCGAR
jgi:hypothetical protein